MAAAWTADDIPDQSGRIVLVTGATSGLGLASAEALAGRGARVLLGARNPAKGEAALRSVAARATGAAPEVVDLDLAALSSVRACAAEVAGRLGHLDVVCNNAGVMAVPLARTADGFESHFGVNHLGHFALTGLLLPLLAAAPAPRVVTISSQAHRMGRIRFDDPNFEAGPYSKWLAYGQSKLANLLFSAELARRASTSSHTLVSAAAHPGYADTHLSAAGPEQAGRPGKARLMSLANRVLAQPAAAGALPQLYAMTMPDVTGGDYFGPAGPGEWRGPPRRVGRAGAATDAEAARRLWSLSERLTGVTYHW